MVSIASGLDVGDSCSELQKFGGDRRSTIGALLGGAVLSQLTSRQGRNQSVPPL